MPVCSSWTGCYHRRLKREDKITSSPSFKTQEAKHSFRSSPNRRGRSYVLTGLSAKRVVQDAASRQNVLGVSLGECFASNSRVLELPALLNVRLTLPAHLNSIPALVLTLSRCRLFSVTSANAAGTKKKKICLRNAVQMRGWDRSTESSCCRGNSKKSFVFGTYLSCWAGVVLVRVASLPALKVRAGMSLSLIFRFST